MISTSPAAGSTVSQGRRGRRSAVVPAGWWFDGLLVAGFAAITAVLAAGLLLGTDLAVRDWCDAHRPGPLYWAARVGNYLGQGGYLFELSIVVAVALAWRRHSVRPLLPVAAGFALSFGTLTPLKQITDRAAPHAFGLAHPERFGSGGQSYPSGHLVNVLIWYGVLALLLAPWFPTALRRVIRIVPPCVVTVTTIYLGFHWWTDTVAGLLLGLFLDRLMHRVPWDRLPLGRWLAASGWAGPGLPGRDSPVA